MPRIDAEMFRLHAEICKTLSHPRRLEILSILRHGEMAVGAIVNLMRASKANVSQHLAIMRKSGILVARRDGQSVHYRISDPKVTRACDLMREVLITNQTQKNRILTKET